MAVIFFVAALSLFLFEVAKITSLLIFLHTSRVQHQIQHCKDCCLSLTKLAKVSSTSDTSKTTNKKKQGEYRITFSTEKAIIVSVLVRKEIQG